MYYYTMTHIEERINKVIIMLSLGTQLRFEWKAIFFHG